MDGQEPEPDIADMIASQIESLRRIRVKTAKQLQALDRAIAALTGHPQYTPGSRPHLHPNGTYALLERFLREGYDGNLPITCSLIIPWMREHGWETSSRDPKVAASNALANLARADPPQLIRYRLGQYYPPDHPVVSPPNEHRGVLYDS